MRLIAWHLRDACVAFLLKLRFISNRNEDAMAKKAKKTPKKKAKKKKK